MMKFITEEYLRDLYRKEPFSTYKLEQGQRLTPGAIEYLSDKRIKFTDNDLKANKSSKVTKNLSPKNLEISLEETAEKTIKDRGNSDLNLNKKLCFKLKSMEAKFLVISSEIVKEDIIIAQNIMSLSKEISKIRNALNGKESFKSTYLKECRGMNSSNLKAELDDCFEITEFYMQLEKSSSILKMHTLRCALRELQFEIIEIYKNGDEDLKIKIIESMNLIINSISQLICLAVGGKECQRKN
ncbi:cobalamin adenosyltransferase [Clostridium oceanicum]|uniref:Cobalamin adenosyltransferase n=1 Tax=Clostridium oceanicum TaxID=1543 RepID=A0ABP3UXT8_9CLOT